MLLPITNLAGFEAWTNNTQVTLQQFPGAFTGFSPTGLSTFSSVQFNNRTVDDYLAVLDSIELEAQDANFAALASQAAIIRVQLGIFTSDFTLLEELFENDISGLEEGIAQARDILDGIDGSLSMNEALADAFEGIADIPTENADDLEGDDGDNIIDLLGGNDVYDGGDGNDTISGGDGLDILEGGAGNDTIRGGDDFDRILGGEGNDKLFGDNGDDRVIGHEGNDKIKGGKGDDDLRGETGKDKLYGQKGDDEMTGGLGKDKLYGDKGDDTLNGGGGKDKLSGGAGADSFEFDKNFGKDKITDFEHDRDMLVFDIDGSFPTDFEAWLADNADIVNGKAVITLGSEGKVTLNGIDDLDLLTDNISFV